MSPLKRWVLGAGLFNITAASPLILPFLCRKYFGLFNSLNDLLGLGGPPLVVPSEGANLLFINTAGLALLLVGILLIYAAADLRNRIGIPFFNAIIRIAFALLASYYLVYVGIAHILISFIVIDAVIGIVFLVYIGKGDVE